MRQSSKLNFSLVAFSGYVKQHNNLFFQPDEFLVWQCSFITHVALLERNLFGQMLQFSCGTLLMNITPLLFYFGLILRLIWDKMSLFNGKTIKPKKFNTQSKHNSYVADYVLIIKVKSKRSTKARWKSVIDFSQCSSRV